MMQEIFPQVFDNSFKPCAVAAESLMFSFQGDTVLVNLDSDDPVCRSASLDYDPDEAVFLFKIDETACFLIEPEHIRCHDGFSYTSLFGIFQKLPTYLAFACATARHLGGWYRANRFCGACGSKLEHSTRERMLFCEHCGNNVYPGIHPVIIVGIHQGDELLLTRYAGRLHRQYALVAGFVEIGETFEDAVRREVMEEVGLRIKNLRYYKSQPWGLSESLIMGFFAEAEANQDIVLETAELSEAVWMPRAEIATTFDNVSITNEMIVCFKENRIDFCCSSL